MQRAEAKSAVTVRTSGSLRHMTDTAFGLDYRDQFSEAWRLYRPLAGDKTGPKRRMSRGSALQESYIEANVTSVLQSLVITDHDGGNAEWIRDQFPLPPSWTSINPHTGNGHPVYVLGSPVCLTDAARRPPVNLLARIEHGLNNVLEGDIAYAGTFTKNPHHQDHLTLWGPATATYGLRELADALRSLGAMPDAGKPRRNVTTSGVGRNVALFDLTRDRAYKLWKQHENDRTDDHFAHGVHRYAEDRNLTVIGNEFSKGPLNPGEVNSISRSIARWTWRKFNRKEFNARQAERGVKSGRTRYQVSAKAMLELGPEMMNS